MSEPRQVLVCGYYGFGNTGDEAILSALVSDIRSLHPEAAITVMSGRPSATEGDHQVKAVHWQDVGAMVAEARDADLMLLGGGGLFQDHHGFDEASVLTPDHGTIGYYSGFGLLARLTRTPLVIYGVGVGPLTSEVGRRWTRIAFEHANSATVRDQDSMKLLEEIGVDTSTIGLGADPTWAFQPDDGGVSGSILKLEDVPEADRTITVAVRPWSDYSWAGALAEGLDHLATELDARVLFIPFQHSAAAHENDPRAAVEVLRRMEQGERAAVIRGDYSVEERASLIASSDLLVGMRLHSVIFGLNSGVPTVALAYDPKVSVAMGEAGSPSLVTPLEHLTPEWIIASGRTAIEEGASSDLEGIRKRVRANRSALKDLGPTPVMSTEAAEAVAHLLVSHAHSTGHAITAVRRLRSENALLQQQHEYDVMAQENLQRQRQELASTKAVRMMDTYWRARQGLKDTAREIGRKAPDSIRPALKRYASAREDAQEAETTPAAVHPKAVEAAREQLQEVLDRHPDVPGIVVYPPSIGWNVSLFQRPQQMALAFARLGYLVFYGVYAQEGIGERIEPRAERLYLYPEGWAMAEAMKGIKDPIALSYVYNFALTRNLTDPRVVFEHIDELEVFTTTHPIEDLSEWYEEAIEGAEVVVGSARDLLETVRPRRPDAFLCPNGVDYRHFADFAAGEPPEDIADIANGDRPIVGYYGALAEWVDYPLIRRSATELPDFEFVFIGPDYDGSINEHTEVFGLPNVRWLGVKGYDELPAYLHYFDVATIPFVVNEVTHSVSPLKLFEYMAGGRPVVTPNLRECAHYEAVQVAQDAADYVEQIRRAALELSNDPEHQALLRRTARANTWEMRVGNLIDALARSGRL